MDLLNTVKELKILTLFKSNQEYILLPEYKVKITSLASRCTRVTLC